MKAAFLNIQAYGDILAQLSYFMLLHCFFKQTERIEVFEESRYIS